MNSISKSEHTCNPNQRLRRLTLAGLLITVGIVFGDIGTSPLYVMKAIVGANPTFDADYIIGAVSCVIWTLTLQTTVKYVLIALHADNKGEGGILALFALLRRTPRKYLYVVAAIGAAALIADGMITPAVTVTSAIEGLRLVAPDVPVTMIVVFIIVMIFMIQQLGTSKIGRFFGPFMAVWFLTLGVLGVFAITAAPEILKAFNPLYAISMLMRSPSWFLILGAVFLCTTGAEALYSDLGHCGRLNITVSWFFVKVMLILNYLGQGAWLITQIGQGEIAVNPFYAIVPHSILIIGVILATCAAIIASQALLSGSFTIYSEAVNLNFWPKIRIKYPTNEKGQLYIPSVNWCLLAGCLMTVAIFRDSSHMEAAYGLAITVAMLMTTVLLSLWMHFRGIHKWVCITFFSVFVVIEGLFFTANLFKFTHGGWYTILVAGVVAAVMVIWRKATVARARYMEYVSLADKASLIKAVSNDSEIPKAASNLVYLSHTSDVDLIESKIIYSIINKSPKRADHYWFVRVEYTDEPDTLDYDVHIVEPDLIYVVTMRLGFRQEAMISVYLREIVEDLVKENKLDLRSGYPSLRARGIAGDFRFIIIHRIFSLSSRCKKGEAFLMRSHNRLRHLGTSDQTAFGLDTSLVTFEIAPLIINSTPGHRITRRRLK